MSVSRASAQDTREGLRWATRSKWLWRAVLVLVVPVEAMLWIAGGWPEFWDEVRGLWNIEDIGYWRGKSAKGESDG